MAAPRELSDSDRSPPLPRWPAELKERHESEQEGVNKNKEEFTGQSQTLEASAVETSSSQSVYSTGVASLPVYNLNRLFLIFMRHVICKM